MHYGKKETLAYLDRAGVTYEMMEHPPVFTIGEMVALGIDQRGRICKNLFLRDGKGKNHYLVVAPDEKQIDLALLAKQLGSTKLSFASAERLEKYLGVAQGSVSPLGVLNDSGHAVSVVFDRSLAGTDRLGVHPNDNTATVWLSFQDLKSIVDGLGNPVAYVDIP